MDVEDDIVDEYACDGLPDGFAVLVDTEYGNGCCCCCCCVDWLRDKNCVDGDVDDDIGGFLVVTVVLTDCEDEMGTLGVYFCLLLAEEVIADEEWERDLVGSPP